MGPSNAATAGPAPPVRMTCGRVVAGQLVDQLPDRPHRAPEQARPHGRHGPSPRAGGGAASSDISTSGSRSVNSCSARADMAMPGRMAPPRNAPSADTRSTVMAVPTSMTTAGRPAGAGGWRPRRPAADRRRPCPAAAVHLQRQVAGGQQGHAVAAAAPQPIDQPRGRRPVHAADEPIKGRRRRRAACSILSSDENRDYPFWRRHGGCRCGRTFRDPGLVG